MTETIVLGLDGATWDLLDPLIESGALPNIERLSTSGPSGRLESTFPPITAPAWLSMATGQNPGKTGVFYFLNREEPDSFDFQTLGSDKFQGQSFWDVLSAHDQSVGIFNYPMLFPPYEIDGFMVSGLGSDADDTITYPESLGDELDDVTDGYQVKVPYADPKYQDRPRELESDLLEIIEKRETAIEYLLTEKDPDHFFGIISATDWAQHYFWRYADEDHALYDPAADHENALKRIWMRVDEAVGTVADLAREDDTTLLIVSDHGFGPINRTFHSNKWLRQRGYTQPPNQSLVDQARTRYFPHLRQIGKTVVKIVPPLNEFAKSMGESLRKSPGENVDFEASIAFAPRQNLTCGMIYMLSDNETAKQDIMDSLERTIDENPETETIDVYEPEDLYHGPKTVLAPDVLFAIDDFECAVDPRATASETIVSGGPPSKARSGGHKREGIVIVSGPNATEGAELDARIFDIAPTLLHLHDSTVPEEMDGEVLFNAFDSGSTERFVEKAPLEALVTSGDAIGRDDKEQVQERLEDLGYI